MTRWQAGILAALCAAAGTASAADSVRVLFVGNSYTYVNELPQRVAELGAAQGVDVRVSMHAGPDLSLADQLAKRSLRILLSQPWDWVVLQQGPSSLPESRAELIESTRTLAKRLRRAQDWRRRESMGLGPLGSTSGSARLVGAPAEALRGPTRIAMFAAWPQLPHAASSPQAEESYRLAAQAVRGCVLPVAAAWRIARESGDAPRLYQEDLVHATNAGTVLAALAIVSGLTGKPLPPLAAPAGADAAERARLQRLVDAAQQALDEEPERCRG